MNLPEQHKNRGDERLEEADCYQAPLIRNSQFTHKNTLSFMKNITKRNQHLGSSPTFSDNWSAQKNNLAFDKFWFDFKEVKSVKGWC